jgi:putative transposase
MAALSAEKTLAELSAEFGVHPTIISNWKQELVKRVGKLFARGSKAPAVEDAQKVIGQLHRKIEQLQVECDFLAGQPAHLPSAERRAMIAPEAGLSVSRQCALFGVARSSFYYRHRPESAEELEPLTSQAARPDFHLFTDHPIYGSRRLQVALLRERIQVGRRRVRRLMRKLGLWAVRPKRNTSKRHPKHQVYPYLLRGRTIDQPNQAWAADITYIPMRQGFLYWSRSSTGQPDECCPGGCQTR